MVDVLGCNFDYWGCAFLIMRRRAADAAKEIADIFSFTAELLAAGDSMREAIFQCYESLVPS